MLLNAVTRAGALAMDEAVARIVDEEIATRLHAREF